MTREIDCRGLACPSPVLETKKALESDHPGIIRVAVDNEAACQNVTRFLETRDYGVHVEGEGPTLYVTGEKALDGPVAGTAGLEKTETATQKIMVMMSTDRMGYGDDRLGGKLMVNFLNTLKEMGNELWRLVLVNNGVKLAIEGAEVLPVLLELEAGGVHILVCGTCLDHFDLLAKKRAGDTTNMLDIVTAMQLADKVITI